MTNEELFKITNSEPLSSRLKFIRLKWAGHVTRMPKYRIPHSMLHGVLKNGTRRTGRPKLRFKDVIKRDLVDFNIQSDTWSQKAHHRDQWRSDLHRGRASDKANNLKKLSERRLRSSANGC